MPSDRAQDVKHLVASLKAEKRHEANEHIKIHRPLGATYQTICRGRTASHVKKIVVEPGAKLSLQKHHHRAEHWVVVTRNGRGDAERQDLDGERERVDLPAARRHPPRLQPRPDPRSN